MALLVITIAGCKGDKNKNSITDIEVRKGTDGLLMEFLPNAPPQNVFENGKFPISLKLKNAGASNIEDNKETAEAEKGILVFGFEKAYVSINEKEQKQEFSIKGKSTFNPSGDELFRLINAEAKKIGEQSEKQPSTILATVCYPYEAILGTSVCIDTDILGQRRGIKACSIKELAFKDGQGAPVTITKIETRMLPQQDNNKVKPHFIIHIKNSGNGEVIGITKKDKDGKDVNIIDKACSNQALEYKDFNVLTVNVKVVVSPGVGALILFSSTYFVKVSWLVTVIRASNESVKNFCEMFLNPYVPVQVSPSCKVCWLD